MKNKAGIATLLLVVLAAAGCTIKYPKAKPVELETVYTQPERTPLYEHEGWIIARASLHNHTTYSDGPRSPEDLLELARIQGMAILAYNDHREGKICLGKSGRLCIQAGGVEQVGYHAYYEHLRQIQEAARERGMIALKGIEVSPPYMYNYGKFPALIIAGQYKHFTVYQVEDPEILARMPVRREIGFKPEKIVEDWPYQDFVNYIVEQGGIVHAVHVEEGQDEWLGPVHILTPPPVYDMHLKNLTGFSILPDAWREKTGQPRGLWDTALLEYLAGMRPRPLWASADADYHGPRGSLANATTLFYMREFSEPEVYRCMREGRMVALQGAAFQDTYVAEWWVSDEDPPENPVMLGQEVKISGIPRIKFALNRPLPDIKVRLIRNGTVIAEQQSAQLFYQDEEQGRKREPAFYRIEVIGPKADSEPWKGPTMPDSELFVNPIFVRFE